MFVHLHCTAGVVSITSGTRAVVKQLDLVKPARSFGDKEEWRSVLAALQEAGKLTYTVLDDQVTLVPLP